MTKLVQNSMPMHLAFIKDFAHRKSKL